MSDYNISDVFKTLKSKLGFLSSYLNASNLFSSGILAAKNAISSITGLDLALKELKSSSSMTTKELENFYYTSNDIARQTGVTTNQVIQQAAAWSKLGFSSAQAAAQMTELSSQFSAISPGMDTDETVSSLASIISAYDVDVDDVLNGIISKINAVGNEFEMSNSEIAEGLELSSDSMSAAGATLEDNIALFAGGQEIIQNAKQVGEAINAVSMRMRSYDEETGLLSSNLSDIADELTDLTSASSNNNQGISIYTDSSQTQYKSLVQYLGEISDIWDELDNKSRAGLLDKLFGQANAQAGEAIISNMDTVRASMDVMADSAGSAELEMSKVMDTIEYKTNQLKETGTGIAQNLFDRDEIKTVLDVVNSLGNCLDWLTSKTGLLGSAGLGAGLFAGFNNIGKCVQVYDFIQLNCFECALYA